MKKKISSLGFIMLLIISCGKKKQISTKYTHITDTIIYQKLGGTQVGDFICPKTVNDVIIQLNNLNPKANVGKPEMTIQGLHNYIKENNITTITQLLNSLPDHYKNNFSLVEITKGDGQSSLQYPRIVLFGPDGHLLMNISTKSNDPKYELLDCAELNIDNGNWEFSQFDFTSEKPVLHRNPKSCISCHGENPRPTWGTNMDWPGVFGDNEASGPNGEALSFRHAMRMNEIQKGNGGSDRFNFLEWENEKLTSGGVRKIANNNFGAELLVSNMHIGTATARGIFLRMKHYKPKLYEELRETFLLLGYDYMFNGLLSDMERRKLYHKYDLNSINPLKNLFAKTGIDMEEAFSLSTLAKKEKPKLRWSLGAGTLEDLVFLQILDDLSNDNIEVRNILASLPNNSGIFKCNGLGKNILEVVQFKMLHMFHLKGAARYQVNKVYYPQDAENIKSKVFEPIYDHLIKFLRNKEFKA
ncbi:hypothetical protein [Aquimarina latercula]|uniref:hypothetical protein n=1 Tax=Aquimarina latercula TaxID=987 RepID=UPI000416001F|nr:hypothetical protein [Aquimarina latercula]